VTIQYDFEASIGYWTSVTALAFHRALNEKLAPLGLTYRQSQVLGCLIHRGTMSQCELAGFMEIEAPTLAGILNRMEAAGWVKRCECREDRRKKLVRITPAAAPVWEQIALCAREVRAMATVGLNERQAAQLRSLLEKVHTNLNQIAASESTCCPGIAETDLKTKAVNNPVSGRPTEIPSGRNK